jgi:hypothetical protein
MSWFGDLLGDVLHQEAVDYVVTGALSVDGTMPTFTALEADTTYLSIRVKSLRLPFTRKGVNKLYGVVHSFADIPGGPGEAVRFATATTPAELAGVDPKNLSKVVTVDKAVVGPTPWWGGDLKLQIGLFSVVEQNLAAPFLSTLTALSNQVGVSFAATAKPFVDVISMGVAALSRDVGSVKLEIGLDRGYDPPVPGHYALIAAPAGALRDAKFDLDSSDGKLKVDGVHYTEKPYIVFTIEAVTQQPRWGEIAELRAAYQKIREAKRLNDQAKAKDALTSFRLLALSSTDLIFSDAQALVKKAEDDLKTFFGSAKISGFAEREPADFEALRLYG